MAIPRLIPVLLVHDKKLQKSMSFDKWTYVGDLLNTAKIFNDKNVDEIVILNTDGNQPDSIENLEILRTVSQECFMPIAYAGGIKNVEQARKIISCGIDKIVVNGAFIDNPKVIEAMVGLAGSSSVVVSIDVIRQNGRLYVYDHRKKAVTKQDLIEQVKLAELSGAGEILIQSVDRDGSRTEPDYELAKIVSDVISVPLVYAGGVSSLDDAAKLWELGINGVAAGAWFTFRGKIRAVMINYPSRELIDARVIK